MLQSFSLKAGTLITGSGSTSENDCSQLPIEKIKSWQLETFLEPWTSQLNHERNDFHSNSRTEHWSRWSGKWSYPTMLRVFLLYVVVSKCLAVVVHEEMKAALVDVAGDSLPASRLTFRAPWEFRQTLSDTYSGVCWTSPVTTVLTNWQINIQTFQFIGLFVCWFGFSSATQ